MAFNARRPMTKMVSENATSNYIGKAKPVEGKNQIKTRRPALCEIKNKIENRDVQAKKAPIALVKPTKITQREPKKVTLHAPKLEVTKKPPPPVVTATKFETESKIKEITEPKSFSSQRYSSLEEEIVGNDPQFVAEYINDIFAHLRNLEEKYKIDPKFLSGHKTTKRMRAILVNWLVEVQINFKLLSETLHLCIAITDRYLQKNRHIGRESLQLVGISALWMAVKYEEMYIPELDDFSYICDNSFSNEEIRKMEQSIIKCLDFSFGRPLSLHFLRRYSRISNAQTEEHNMAKYFLELALLDYDLCHVKPSLQAAAAIYLALSVFNGENGTNKLWDKALIHYSTYTFTDIANIVKLLAVVVINAETSIHQAIRNKYASSNNGKISLSAELKGPIVKKFAEI